MTAYFLGLDAGGTKTHALVTDANGYALGFGRSGPGSCGCNRLSSAIPNYAHAIDIALRQAGLRREQIAASAFGLSGYDWTSQTEYIRTALSVLELPHSPQIANDALIGLIGGAPEGWGVAIVAGTGENCRGRDRQGREGRTVGDPYPLGDAGGAVWLAHEAMLAVAHAWTGRSPSTLLTQMMLDVTGAVEVAQLLEGVMCHQIEVSAQSAPLVFDAAVMGDKAALAILEHAGRELGLNAAAVIRQLNLQSETFDVVLVGGVFDGSHPTLMDSLKQHVRITAPKACFIRPVGPPVVGAALLAMETAGASISAEIRQRLNETTSQLVQTMRANAEFPSES